MGEDGGVTALPVVVVMGVSGVGKSTVGTRLAEALGVPFVDGDDLHPPANRAKMAAGHPLDDDDRRPWLDAVEAWIDADAAACCGGVVACSALKRRYRDRLRRGGANVWFLHLDAPHDVVEARMLGRRNHAMPVSLLDSQESDLEPLQPDEDGMTVPATRRVDRIVNDVVSTLVPVVVPSSDAPSGLG
jgi:gluconokinase